MSHILIVKEALYRLYLTKGIDKAFVLDGYDRRQIQQLEEKDECMSPSCFGKKHNVGIKQVLGSDVLISFITNSEYDWPESNIKIYLHDEVIGEQITDVLELEQLRLSGDHLIIGNMVIDHDKYKMCKNTIDLPRMVIDAYECPQIEDISYVSEAMMASPSRLTDTYIKSRTYHDFESMAGTFLLGLNLSELSKEYISAPDEITDLISV